ncbi:MAG: glycosyltransferase, partial [Oscillospiraceae bacterium]|nr:glycosyltransferase [Oscillospiraceae bacterium]
MIRLSVIIVTYNCFDLLKKCLESVFRYNDIGEELEVIVVDNGDDGSYERIKGIKGLENVIAIRHENTGYGAGNNAGAEISNGEVLLFLNPDTELIEPVFSFSLDKFDHDPKLGCFGVQLVDKNMQHAPSGGFRLHMGFLKVQSYRILNMLGIFLPKSMFTSGADLFVKRDAFYESGAFDENIFMYCEEAD